MTGATLLLETLNSEKKDINSLGMASTEIWSIDICSFYQRYSLLNKQQLINQM